MFSIKAATRLIFSKKKKTFINFLSIISISTLTIGATAMIVVLSVYNGLENTLKSVYNDFDPEIKIVKKENIFFENVLINKIRSVKNVSAVTSVLENKVILQNKEKEVVANLKGVGENFIDQKRIINNMTEGEFFFNQNKLDYAVFGRGIKYSLGITSDTDFQNIKVYSLNNTGRLNPMLLQQNLFNQKNLKVAGVFAIENSFDNSYVFSSLLFAQDLFNKKNMVSSYEVKLVDESKIIRTKEELMTLLGNEYSVLSNIEQREALFKILGTEKFVVYLVFLAILFLSSINIFFLLIMMGVQKRKDIAIMYSFGAKRFQIRNIFIFQGLIIGLTSGIFGSFFGWVITWTQKTFGVIQIEMTSSLITAYPVDFLLKDLFNVFIMVIVVSLLASVIPSIISTSKYNFSNINKSFV